MKATELQIGDYVNYRGQIIKVTSLYDKGGSNEVGWSNKESVWVNADIVEPISITPEILEKNGFKRKNRYNYIYKDNYCGVRVSFAPKIKIDNIDLGDPPINVSIEGALFDINMTIDAIHELQQALRLCGIEKEIIL